MNGWRFRDRRDAGVQLGRCLHEYAGRPDVLVLGLPRGGVPVAYEVARLLDAPLDVLIVRKLGVPGYEELAMGAIASGGVQFLHQPTITGLRIPAAAVERVVAGETAELKRRERSYRGDRPFPEIAGMTVVVVDDGLATGATMTAAVAALRGGHPAAVIVAVPVASREAHAALAQTADGCVAVHTPEPFGGVGRWYEDFTQMTDREVERLLANARRTRDHVAPF